MVNGSRARSPFRVNQSGPVSAVRVVDGDSIECDFKGRQVRVRLYGIDAPELKQPDGPEAADALSVILHQYEPLMMEVKDKDHYGRLIGLLYRYLGKSEDSVNLRMVRNGHAYAFTRFGGSETGLRDAEQDARASRRGLWQGDGEGGERPWKYRERAGSKVLGRFSVARVLLIAGGMVFVLILLLIFIVQSLLDKL